MFYLLSYLVIPAFVSVSDFNFVFNYVWYVQVNATVCGGQRQ